MAPVEVLQSCPAMKRPRRPWKVTSVYVCPGNDLGCPRTSWIKIRKGCLGYYAYPAAAERQTQISGGEWVEGVIHLFTFGSQIVFFSF